MIRFARLPEGMPREHGKWDIRNTKPRNDQEWYALAKAESGVQPWVVWRWNGTDNFYDGHYFRKETDAVQYFNKASRITAMRRTSRTAMRRTAVEEPNWNELKKDIWSWNIFEGHSYRNNLSVESLIEFLESGMDMDSIVDMDYFSDTSWDITENILKDNDYDPIEIQEEYPDEFDELRFAVEEKANFNIEDILPTKVLVQIDEFELIGPVDGGYKEGELEEFTSFAKKNGFSEAEAKEVYENATYGGMAGIGCLVDDWDLNYNNPKVSGDKVLYIHDRMNGSGDFEITGETSMSFSSPKELAKHIDYGSYSMEGIFGMGWSR